MKRTLSLTLTLVLCLSLIPLTAAAYGNQWIQMTKSNFDPNEEIVVTVSGITAQMVADDAYVSIYEKGAPHTEYMEWYRPEQGTTQLTFTAPVQSGDYEMRLYRQDYTYRAEDLVTSVPFTVGKVAKVGTIALDKTVYTAFEKINVSVSGITAQMVTSKAFVGIYEKGAKHDEYSDWGRPEQGSSILTFTAPNKNGAYEMRLYSTDYSYTDESFVMSVPFTVTGATVCSPWAVPEIEKAVGMGLIPDSLKNADYTKPITRAEFAAVAVKLYENLTGKKAVPVSPNPFTDTNDPEVLKAYNLGITNGTSATTFTPGGILNRQEAATMLTRVVKAAYIQGWTLATDSQYTLTFTMPAKFNDDAKISAWAKPSVYFMVANNIIKGMGGNNFAPQNTTSAEIAVGYANNTREQALAIAVRIVENLKDKPLNYN